MMCLTKKGFTLVELMIVIAIIGILAGALTTQFGSIMESARTTKCKANMRTLAQAVQAYSTANHQYPEAGSYEWENPKGEWTGPLNNQTFHRVFIGERGWVTWTKGGIWPWDGRAKGNKDKSLRDGMTVSSFYGPKGGRDVPAYLSVTNGVLWELVGKVASVYVCESHRREVELTRKGDTAYRSYVMSGHFGYDDKHEAELRDNSKRSNTDDAIQDGKAAIRLLFAELPRQEIRTDERFADSVLEYEMNDESNSKDESIGFNHLVAKRWVGHVAFLDGHVEGLVLPNGAKNGNGLPDYTHKDVRDLTGQLCGAQEISSKIRESMR